MKLRINCGSCDARKIDENNYTEYEKIIINTEEMIVDDRSKAILNKLPFDITADEMRSESLDNAGHKAISINGVYDITPNSSVEEGCELNINGMLRMTKGCENVLKSYKKISINGMILCPNSISAILPLPGVNLNGIIKSYPDDYTLLDNKYKLDKYFPLRASADSGYFAARYVYDNDPETDFQKLSSKNVKFSTDKVYLRKSHLEQALPLFNIEANVVEVPDDCTIYVAESPKFSQQIVNSYGTKLFVIGDILIKKEDREALEELDTLIVDGEVKLDESCRESFDKIGGKCTNLVVLSGFTLTDRPIVSIDKSTLDNHPEGVAIRDCALVKLDKDIPADLIRERLKISDCAKVNCSNDQKAAVTEVSLDVALISSGGFANSITNLLFGNVSSAATPEDDTKYVNADYYEL